MVVAIVAICVAAAVPRLLFLGRLSFWADELPHAVAGRSLSEGSRPELPSGSSYRRALVQTAAVAGAMKVLGPRESSARIPSALAGIAAVPLLWAMARRRFGDVAALAAASALAAMPAHVAHSRSARMYALFVLAYGVAAFAASEALRTRRALAAGLSIAAFALAVHLQIIAVLLLLPLGMEALALAVRRGGRARSLAGLFAGAAAGLAVVAVAVPPLRELAGELLRFPVPGIELDPGLRAAPLAALAGALAPPAWAVVGPAVLVALRGRDSFDAATILMHAFVPALALGLLYRGIGVRYLLHLAPFVALVAGIGVARVASVVRGVRVRAVAAALGGAVAVAGLGATWSMPALGHPGPRNVGIPGHANWKGAAAFFAGRARDADGLVTTAPLAAWWYLGRCGSWLRGEPLARPYLRDGRDLYCGTDLISDEKRLRRRLAADGRVWVVADRSAFRHLVDAGSRRLIAASGPPAWEDGTMLVFLLSSPSS